ncbi:MAG: transglycosylase domain-containing protein [Actinomycetota bacterium]
MLATSCAELEHLPLLTKKDRRFKPPQSSRIFADDGSLITTLHGAENRTIVHHLRTIPKHVQNSVIAIEDQRFYEHSGVDLHSIIRAIFANVSSGSIAQGGSTITQQLVKNTIIAPHAIAERTLQRKLEEAALARQLEKKLSKHEILLRYLNTVYFGEGAYGIQAASHVYFGKSVRNLSLAEGATLAGLIQAPEDYDPYKHPAAAKVRRNIVLGKMEQLGWADPVDVARAQKAKLHLQQTKGSDRYPAAYFVDYVQRLITYDHRFNALGDDVAARQKKLFSGGLKIFTTVNLDDQAAAESAVQRILPYKTDPHAALVSIDPNTGYVKAMVGGRDWFATAKQDPYSKLNLATLAEPDLGRIADPNKKNHYLYQAPGSGRQAGSSFKPFALAAAIKQGIPLSERFKAASCMDFPGANAGGNWHVCNYEGESFASGMLSLLEATVHSVNVVYAQLILKVGAQAVVDIARQMGIKTTLLAVPSAVLGANPVNALDMASAYGTLAASGRHHEPVAITKIEDSNGKVIYRDSSTSTQAIDPAVAYITTTALEQVVQRGTGTAANVIGRPVAGKTGTAQEYRDAWFIGYTPDLVTSVWIGYPQGEIEMKPSCAGSISPCIPTRTITSGGMVGGSFPAEIWAAYMIPALSGIPASNFTQPAVGLVTVTIDIRTGCLAGKFTPPEDRASGTFEHGTEPTKTCRVPGDRKTVPDVSGFPKNDAEQILTNAGFTVQENEAPSSTYPPGRVIAQSPDGGTKAPAGSTVTITISSKQQATSTVTVPDVLGMTRSDAESRLTGEGFTVREVTQKESSPGQAKKNRGKVWKQSPPGGSHAKQGATITIWINPN